MYLTSRFRRFRSNDYSYNQTNSEWKALLLNKVVVGRGLKLTQDDPTITQPPLGFDSVGVSGQSFQRRRLTRSLGPRRSRPRRSPELRRARRLRQRCGQAIISRHVRRPLASLLSYHNPMYFTRRYLLCFVLELRSS